MREMFWDSALLVRLQNGVERIFSGPYDALDFSKTNGRYAKSRQSGQRQTAVKR